jgi:hypothetical protein
MIRDRKLIIEFDEEQIISISGIELNKNEVMEVMQLLDNLSYLGINDDMIKQVASEYKENKRDCFLCSDSFYKFDMFNYYGNFYCENCYDSQLRDDEKEI